MQNIKPINRSNIWQAFPLFLLPLAFLLITACPDPQSEKPKRNTTIHLEVLSTFTTTARLHISVEDTTAEWTFSLTRNGEDVLTATVYRSDTAFSDQGLNPNTQYIYQAQWLEDGIAVDSSLNAVAQTMDTTSHNFVWTIDTLGEYGSYLNDVAIIDENNIWVVGKIKVPDPDSSFNGTGWETFNAAHWNGNEWELVLIDRVVDFDGVFAFSEDEIWFSDGCFIYEFDGSVFSKKWECDWETYGSGQVKEIWGSSPNGIYFVGNSGSIVHYDGVEFEKIESGGTVRLIDVEGSVGGEYVFIAGMDFYTPAHTAAYMIFDGSIETLYYSDSITPSGPDDFGAVSGVSVYGDTAYFVTYQGFWKYNYKTGESVIDESIENYQYHSIKVQAQNDILMVGGGFKYVHYNGNTWDFNNTLFNNYPYSTYGGTFKNNTAVIVGYIQGGAHGIVAIGNR